LARDHATSRQRQSIYHTNQRPLCFLTHTRTGQDERRRLYWGRDKGPRAVVSQGACCLLRSPSSHISGAAMKAQHPTSPSPRKTIAPLRPGLALLLLVCGCCMPLSQAFLPSHSSQGGRLTRSLLGLGPSSPSPWSSLPLGRRARVPLYSMSDKGGNKRRRPRRQGNGNDSDDEEEEEEEYRAMRPAALDRVRPPPPPRVRPGNCKIGC
jgi:hypothetical protein